MDAGCGNGMDVAFAEQYVGLALELHLATILWFEEDSSARSDRQPQPRPTQAVGRPTQLPG